MNSLPIDDILVWLPNKVTKLPLKISPVEHIYESLPTYDIHIIGLDKYKDTGLILPRCGSIPTSTNPIEISRVKELSNIKLNVQRIPVPIKNFTEDNYDDLTEIDLFEEIVAIICQFLSHYENDIYPRLLDYDIIYNTLCTRKLTLNIELTTIPKPDFLENLRNFKFPHPLSYDVSNITIEENAANLTLLNKMLFYLWNKISSFNNGTLKGGYIPDYISFMGWVNDHDNIRATDNTALVSEPTISTELIIVPKSSATPKPVITHKLPITPKPTITPKPVIVPKSEVTPKFMITPKLPITPKPLMTPKPLIIPKSSTTLQSAITPEPTTALKSAITPKFALTPKPAIMPKSVIVPKSSSLQKHAITS